MDELDGYLIWVVPSPYLSRNLEINNGEHLFSLLVW